MTMTLPLPRVLITNDDGFDAPGLAILAEAAKTIASEVWIIAPQSDQSGMSQSVTLNNPLRLQPRGDKQWSITGTPSDCVAIAHGHVMKDAPPALVLSGVNAGRNVGEELNLSGTMGAAFTGLMLGIPSIAVSMNRKDRGQTRWETAKALLPDLLINFLREGWDKNHCLSINLPDVPPEQVTGLCWTHPARKIITSFIVDKREDLREKNYFWIYPDKDDSHADAGSDIAALERGQISVSALTLDRSVPVIVTPFGKKTANDE